MIENIIKILNKLKNNIEKYSVVCNYYKDKASYTSIWIPFSTLSEIEYTKNNVRYHIYLDKDEVIFRDQYGIKLVSTYTDEISKLELLKLAAVIYQNCKDCLLTEMQNFADEVN